ncbi:MAG: adhesin, partial [Bartonella sp.]|nr:adhesin [Bartonella sp.]
MSDSLVKRVEETNVITIGKEIGGTEIALANSEGKARTLSGVKAAEHDNEAVNKGQLDESLKDLSNSLQSDESAVVHYDKKGDDNNTINYESVTFGKGKDSAPVALHNVADGQISKGSHDAINGSQINTISGDVARFLGGGAAFSDGAFTGPSYKISQVDADGNVKQDEFTDVGSAFA